MFVNKLLLKNILYPHYYIWELNKLDINKLLDGKVNKNVYNYF